MGLSFSINRFQLGPLAFELGSDFAELVKLFLSTEVRIPQRILTKIEIKVSLTENQKSEIEWEFERKVAQDL